MQCQEVLGPLGGAVLTPTGQGQEDVQHHSLKCLGHEELQLSWDSCHLLLGKILTYPESFCFPPNRV